MIPHHKHSYLIAAIGSIIVVAVAVWLAQMYPFVDTAVDRSPIDDSEFIEVEGGDEEFVPEEGTEEVEVLDDSTFTDGEFETIEIEGEETEPEAEEIVE